ncbi:hypothetical protein LEN26_021159 [Aphanomyces euteiches]|nr:hypothetical protein LEN26_021159 [Aphanomyces euteiches]KAH9102371.1 hypothetical protein AeMF1_021033 [Aphanomyces euteiches]KAH9111228.1 hypothetical protein AeMF1_014194 [Aphanomyces euteiches]KAH9119921.1 hypothetical protein AeMF1_007654 [Aphanomyces euteiches]KAH9121537.1 hypothetical protein AeMF1_006802 [Aphanomyces euteiches]
MRLFVALALIAFTTALRSSVERRERVAATRSLLEAGGGLSRIASGLGRIASGRWTDGDEPEVPKGDEFIKNLGKSTQVSLDYRQGKLPKLDQSGNRVPYQQPGKSRLGRSSSGRRH